MAKNYQYNSNQLVTGSLLMVDGMVSFSRITRVLDGEELKADNDRKRQNGIPTRDRPHTRIQICNACVNYADPNAKTIGEIYLEERLWPSAKHPENGLSYEGVNIGNRLPYVAVMDGNIVKEIKPEGELANGLAVTLVLRVYDSGQQNKGVGLEGVIVREPIRYFSNHGAGLAERGLVFEGLPQTEEESMPNPAATPNPVQPPQGDAYTSRPATNPNAYGNPPQRQATYGQAPNRGQQAQGTYGRPAQTAQVGGNYPAQGQAVQRQGSYNQSQGGYPAQVQKPQGQVSGGQAAYVPQENGQYEDYGYSQEQEQLPFDTGVRTGGSVGNPWMGRMGTSPMNPPEGEAARPGIALGDDRMQYLGQ